MIFKSIFTILLGVALLAAFTNGLSMAKDSEDELASQEQQSLEAREADLDSQEQDSFEAREDDFDSEEQDSFEAREADLDAEEEDSFEAREDDFESEEEDSLEAREDDFYKRAGGNDQRGFQQEMLAATNKYRQCHSARPLRLDSRLSRSAQNYAQKLARMNRGLIHSKTRGLGENLYYEFHSPAMTSVRGLAQKATKSWYDEVHQYNFNNGGFSMATGHFTQLVWKATQRVGVGYAFAEGKKKIYIVAQYSPQGNVGGQYQKNVARGHC